MRKPSKSQTFLVPSILDKRCPTCISFKHFNHHLEALLASILILQMGTWSPREIKRLAQDSSNPKLLRQNFYLAVRLVKQGHRRGARAGL
jgi:hypothetical protein